MPRVPCPPRSAAPAQIRLEALFDQPKTEIELADGTVVDELRSRERWVAARKGGLDLGGEQATPVTAKELVDERHHHYYGKPWLAGRYIFEHLRGRGLGPADRVLDVGCGAGRVGIWLIGYLDPGRYFGVDSHLRSLIAFARYELVLHGLTGRRPRLMLDNEFRFDAFGTDFDVILDSATINKREPADIERGFANARRVLAPDGRLFSSRPPKLGFEGMAALGLELVERASVPYPLFADLERVKDEAEWFEYRPV